MKLIGVVGEPATGKTTLVRAVLQRLGGNYTLFKYRLVYGRQYPSGLFVLGIYRDGETFGGTDRLSMAVQPDAVRFLKKVPAQAIVLFEGDRLTRAGFLKAAGSDLLLFVLEASPDEKTRRHRERADTQAVTFHRSRATLIERIAQDFPAVRLRNDSLTDLERNTEQVASMVVG
jgi:molybdopterin-guanine dinucleotide biosynthesis protein